MVGINASNSTIILDAAGDAVVGNAAAHGGGGGFYFHYDATVEPRAPPAYNTLRTNKRSSTLGNSALFGKDVATGPRSLKFQRAYYAGEASGEALNATGLTVMVKDAYGSTVKTFSGALTIVEAVGANGSTCSPDLSGDTKADFAAGLATFEDLAIYCAPGAEVRLRASLSTDCCGDFEAETVVGLRNCVAGEYLYEDSAGKVSCQACPAGSVSYEPAASCARCPDNAACAGGHGLVPDRGYWRGAGDSLNVLKCASDDFCAADVDLWDFAPLETARSPSPQCAHRHAGPRCALCERGTYLEEASLKCRACASDASIDDTSYALAGVALGIVFLALVLYGLWRRYGHVVVDSETFAALNEKWLPLLVPKLKIAVVTFQIVGSFSEAFASVTYPRSFGEFARSLDVLGFDPTALFSESLACSYKEWDYLTKLQKFTVVPVVVLGVLFVAYRVAERRCGPEAKPAFALAGLLVAHLSYTTVSGVVLASLFCDDDYDDEPDGSPFEGGEWLAADYSVDCKTARYKWHAIYAVFCIFIYPIGVPLCFFLALLAVRDKISVTRDHAHFVDRILAGGDGVLEVEVSLEASLEPCTTDSERSFRRRYSSSTPSGTAPLSRREKTAAARLYQSRLAVHRAAVEYVHVRDAIREFRTRHIFNATSMYANVKVRDRTIRPCFENSTRAIDSSKNRGNPSRSRRAARGFAGPRARPSGFGRFRRFLDVGAPGARLSSFL